MIRSAGIRKCVGGAMFAAACVLASTAFAQAPKGSQPLPDVPPPPRLSDKPTPADQEEATSVTTRQEGETKIEEFRTRGGRLYAVRVTPRIGKPYMLFDPDGQAAEPTTSDLERGVRPAQWTLFEF